MKKYYESLAVVAIGSALSFFVFSGAVVTFEPFASSLLGQASNIYTAGSTEPEPEVMTEQEWRRRIAEAEEMRRRQIESTRPQNPGGTRNPDGSVVIPVGQWVYDTASGKWKWCTPGGKCSDKPPKTI